jgi:flagellar biosynthesis GTPase FlhF
VIATSGVVGYGVHQYQQYKAAEAAAIVQQQEEAEAAAEAARLAEEAAAAEAARLAEEAAQREREAEAARIAAEEEKARQEAEAKAAAEKAEAERKAAEEAARLEAERIAAEEEAARIAEEEAAATQAQQEAEAQQVAAQTQQQPSGEQQLNPVMEWGTTQPGSSTNTNGWPQDFYNLFYVARYAGTDEPVGGCLQAGRNWTWVKDFGFWVGTEITDSAMLVYPNGMSGYFSDEQVEVVRKMGFGAAFKELKTWEEHTAEVLDGTWLPRAEQLEREAEERRRAAGR